MKAAADSVLDLVGLALMVVGVAVLLGIGAGLIAAGGALLLVSWAMSGGRSR
mgnify:CR=1 FL=1